MTQAKLTDQLQIAYMQGKANAQREMMIGFDGAGNKPGEDGPYRPPDKKDVPGVPPGYPHIPKPTKLAKKNKKSGGIYGKSDKKYEVPDTDTSDLYYGEVASDPSFTVGGSKGNKTNQKIIKSGDANAPNAADFMKIRNLGPAMFPIKKADAQGLTDVLSPHQNPRSGSLKDSGLTDEQKIQLLIRGAAAHKA